MDLLDKFGFTRAEKAYRTKRELPPGHIAIQEAQLLLDKEYGPSRIQERKFRKKYGMQYFRTLQDAANFSGELCNSVGTRMIKEVRFVEPNHEQAGAYYYARMIFIRLPVSCITMVHETAHHIVSAERINPGANIHGEGFLEVERMLSWFKFNFANISQFDLLDKM